MCSGLHWNSVFLHPTQTPFLRNKENSNKELQIVLNKNDLYIEKTENNLLINASLYSQSSKVFCESLAQKS